jgi:hypothetical protein
LGCRLDAWPEYLKRDIWTDLLCRHKELVNETLGEKKLATELSWSSIACGTTESFFKRELGKSHTGEITPPCMTSCSRPCGVCGNSREVVQNNIQPDVNFKETIPVFIKKTDPDTHRIVFSFRKYGTAVFHSHLGLLEIFSMAFIRAGIPVLYSQGFNPLPRLEIASPLSLGIKAEGEIALIDTEGRFDAEQFKNAFNASLPDGFAVVKAMNVFIASGRKKHSLSSLLWGFVYAGKDGAPEMIPAKEEKTYRDSRIAQTNNVYNLERLSVLAKKNRVEAPCADSYFNVYRELYPDSENSRLTSD